VPGSIHEGGELGYSLAHAFGAVFDNPDLIVACVVGDGEAETGPLATSWHANKFVDPVHDGAVLPILHLNGYKIANPTVLARISHRGAGRAVAWHQEMAAVLDDVIKEIQATAAAAHLVAELPAHLRQRDGGGSSDAV
jgi:xylulose-5-phosphate/fructose-6-phosphate phosphoketolase